MGIHNRNIGLALALLTGLALASPARGQGDDGARDVYRQAVENFKAGRYKAAAADFRKAHALKPSWKMLYNIGQSEAAASRYGLALEAFEAYLVEGADQVPADRREEVLSELQRMRVLVGVIEVKAEAGVELSIDEVVRGVTPFEGPVREAVGKHHAVLRKGGVVLLEKDISVAGGMTTTLEVESKPAPAAPPPPPAGPAKPPAKQDAPAPEPAPEPSPPPAQPEAETEIPWMLIGGISAMVVGAGGVGLGAYYTYQGNQDYDEYTKVAKGGDPARFDDLNNNILPLDRTMMIVGYAVGGVFLAGGATLVILATMGDESAGQGAVFLTPGGIEARF